MADEKGAIGFGIDPAKTNMYGVDEDRATKLHQTLEDSIHALEQRYAQPNYFKVAAGFAKPQLGGFLASLGSASEAMGENVENQRAQMLPIAQMKAQLAQSDIAVGQNKKVASAIEQWRKDHPNETPSKELISEWSATSPDSPVVKSLEAQMRYEKEQQTIELTRIQTKLNSNMPLTSEEKEYLNKSTYGNKNSVVNPAPEPSKPSAVEPPASKTIVDRMKKLPDGRTIGAAENQLAIFADELKNDPNNPFLKKRFNDARDYLEKNSRSETPTEPTATTAPKSNVKYPHSVPFPSTEGIGPEDRIVYLNSYKENAKAAEEPYAVTMANLQPTVTGNNYTRIASSFDSAISLMENNKELARKVFAMLRNNPFEAAMAEGFGIHAGSFNANVSLPIRAFKDAGLDDKAKNFADKLFSALMTITMASLKQQGVSMNRQTAQAEYMKAMSAFASPDQTPDAAINILNHGRADFNHNKEYYDTVMKERRENVDPKSATPLADIHQNSKALNSLNDKYYGIKKIYDDNYEKKLRGEK